MLFSQNINGPIIMRFQSSPLGNTDIYCHHWICQLLKTTLVRFVLINYPRTHLSKLHLTLWSPDPPSEIILSDFPIKSPSHFIFPCYYLAISFQPPWFHYIRLLMLLSAFRGVSTIQYTLWLQWTIELPLEPSILFILYVYDLQFNLSY
jgi:hypothetical protein